MSVERPVDAAQDRRHVGARAAAGIEHVDVVRGEAVGDAKILLERLVHARHHVGDDLARRVPDAQLLAQHGIEGLQERLVEELHRVGVVELLQELLFDDAVERGLRPVEQLDEAERLQLLGGRELLVQRAHERHVEVPDRLLPLEAPRRRGLLPGPQHPGREHAVEQRLHQRGAEEVLALVGLELHAERFFERRLDAGEPGQLLLRLHPLQRVAGIGGEEPREVLGLAQRHRLRERALQVLAERAADALRRLAGRRDQLPERCGVLGEAEALALACTAVRLLADDEEIAQVGDDHQPVGLEILGDLIRPRLQPGVVRDRLHLDDAPLGHLALAGRALLELAGGEQPEIRMPGASVLEIGEAEHPPLQVGADAIQQAGDGGIVGALVACPRPGDAHRAKQQNSLRQS